MRPLSRRGPLHPAVAFPLADAGDAPQQAQRLRRLRRRLLRLIVEAEQRREVNRRRGLGDSGGAAR